MSNSKKKTAAVSAVMCYLQEEEAALQYQAAFQDMTSAAAHPPAAPARPWGVSGRQEMMQLRSMMQLKAFHRIK